MADRRLQVFHAVAKHGSFTRAAEHLHMTQPAVTFQIKQLEEHFDTRLLDRGHGKITLTTAGELVLAYAERILGLSAELDSRVSELTDELAGQIKIGTSTTIAAYWLPQILEGFKRRYPRVLPRVLVGTSKLTEDRVAARELDIGLIEIATEQHSIERHSAARDELLVICRPDHPLARFERLSAKDLVGYPFIDRDPGNGIRQIADEFLRDRRNRRQRNHAVRRTWAAWPRSSSSPAAGLGFAIASRRAIRRDVEEGRLAAVPLEPRTYTPLEVIVPRDKFRSRLITAFADYACEQFTLIAEQEEREQ